MVLHQLVQFLWSKKEKCVEKRAILIKIVLPIVISLVVIITALCCYFFIFKGSKDKGTNSTDNNENAIISEDEELLKLFDFIRDDDDSEYSIIGCKDKNIKEVTIPDMFNGKPVVNIASAAFANCKYLQSLTIGDNVREIGIYAFSGCSNLRYVKIGKNVNAVYDHAFDGCGIQYLSINYKNVKSEFSNLISLQTLIIGDNVTTINSLAFQDCLNLSNVEIGSGINNIYIDSFKNCPITDLKLNYSSIHNEFAENLFLKNLTIGANVASISRNAFSTNANISRVEFDKDIDWTLFSGYSACFLSDGTSNIEVVLNGTKLDNISVALNKLSTLRNKNKFDVKIDASLVGQITNTYDFASIGSIT